MGVRGVNLGGWLVYEKWMGSPYLSRISSEDDHDMVRDYPRSYLKGVLEEHWDNYITEEDFRWMADKGVDTVRLPIPYHLFGTEHHIPCVEYVDKAMDWAGRNGIKVLLDLHTTPMSHNGYDNGGYIGMCAWHHSNERVEWTLELLKAIAMRYGISNALWGIEPLNEPASDYAVKLNAKKYWNQHPDRIRASSGISHDFLKRFYMRFYDDAVGIMKPDAKIVISDRYQPKAWNYFMGGMLYRNVVIDTHKYLVFRKNLVKRETYGGYLGGISMLGDEVAEASKFHEVVVGEWCMAGTGLDEWACDMASFQLAQWDRGNGGFFWSYRNDSPGFERWSFRKCVENGWIDFTGRRDG